MIQRHQDYQITVPYVQTGGREVTLELDSDAMFSMRSFRTRGLGASPGIRFQYFDKRWQSQHYRTDWVTPTIGGVAARPQRGGVPLYPELVYPTGSQVVIDIANETGEQIDNVSILFRGSKWFNDGALLSPTYPERMSVLPFIYPLTITVPPVCRLTDIPLNIQRDADFVVKYGVADPGFLGVEGGPVFGSFNSDIGDGPNRRFNNFQNLYVQIRDEARKPFSNEPIHINDLFGQGDPYVTVANGGDDDPVLFLPGLFTPEIYIQADHAIYFDIIRNDVGAGWGDIELNFRFGGMKVFRS